MKNALIVGYGRAGKRHARYLKQYFDWNIVTVDPFVVGPGEHYEGLEQALYASTHYDCAIICTPPDQHIQQIKWCLDARLPTLCEKPLCALGQLEEARKLPRLQPLMFGFNYRFHAALLAQLGKPVTNGSGWTHVASQHRDNLPPWGLLLDHVSHSIDIISFMSQGITGITYAYHGHCGDPEMWVVKGTTYTGPFTLYEQLYAHPEPRQVALATPAGIKVEIDGREDMYYQMLWDFLHGEYCPTLAMAIETQSWLEEIARWHR